MGTGIAIVGAVKAKKQVLLLDAAEEALKNSLKVVDKTLARDVEKGRLTDADAQAARARITTHSISGIDVIKSQDVDFVVEAATENPAIKAEIFKKLDELTRPDVILASNTSSISITKIASAVTKPDKVVGMHFFNPVPVMKIVELISGLQTSQETVNATTALAQDMGKVVTQSKDLPGFIANRVLMPYINEAFMVLQEGTASVEHIDTTMKLGTNVPMGPLTLADFIGLDTCLSIMEVLHTGFGDSKYRPCPLLRQYVEAGRLGRKSGWGVYDYRK